MEQVVGNNSRFVIGDMFELRWIGYVSQRPDSFDVGAQLCVGDDVAVVIGCHPGGCDFELVAVGNPAGGDQQFIAAVFALVGLQHDLIAFATGSRRC